MRVAVTGASGLIGTALVTSLQRDRHDVVRLVRRVARGADEARWDPVAGTIDVDALEGVDAVVHLAGAGFGDKRHTEAYRRSIMDSRVKGTRTLVAGLGRLTTPPSVLVSGSAIGVYGHRGDEELTEASSIAPEGQTFAADVVRAWEAETTPASDAGIRVAHLRTGLVMSVDGGAFGRLLPLIKLGVGGPLGSGKQWWSWITMEDEVRAIRHLIDQPISGPVNLTAPQPQRNATIVRALGRAFHRPAVVPVPAFALKAAVGGFTSEILASQRVLPARLLESGFTFTHPDLDSAAAWVADS